MLDKQKQQSEKISGLEEKRENILSVMSHHESIENTEEKNIDKTKKQEKEIAVLKKKIKTAGGTNKKINPLTKVYIDGKEDREYFEGPAYFYGKNKEGKKDVRSNYQGAFTYEIWDNDRFWKPLVDKAKNLIDKKIIQNERVLDIGCALGFFSKRIEPYFKEVYGFDISKDAVARARKECKQGKFATINLNSEEIPNPNKHFDLITALDVLEHTQDMKKSFQKIIPKLKDNGRLIISVPVLGTWSGWLFSKFDKDKSHISVLPQKELFKIISEVGLDIEEKKYFFNSGVARIYNSVFAPDIELVLKKSKDR